MTAISDSPAEKARIEADLRRRAPKGVVLTLDISAPRPVITPFTLRFLIDETGAHFDACSADTEQARAQIIAAAAAAGAGGDLTCTIGLGVPTPAWADAVTMGVGAVSELGSGSITFSDADISLIAAPSVSQDTFDRVVGELESGLPDVFSLHAVLTPKPKATGEKAGPPEFTASLGTDGSVQLRGLLPDARTRDVVSNFARAEFGAAAVLMATRIQPDLPKGWPLRVLTAVQALAEVDNGTVLVRPDLVKIAGVSGAKDASDTVSRILSEKLGQGQEFDISVKYDEKLDPLAGLPTPEECVADLNGVLAEKKIPFDPGSANIAPEAKDTIDKLAAIMKTCVDVPMEVGGFTDSQGREEMNLQLSKDRAQAVVAALMARRVLTGNLTAKGYGETEPVASNDTEEGREANRRIAFRLLTAADTTAPADGTAENGEATGGDGDGAAASDSETVIPVQAADDATPRPPKRPDTLADTAPSDGTDLQDPGPDVGQRWRRVGRLAARAACRYTAGTSLASQRMNT